MMINVVIPIILYAKTIIYRPLGLDRKDASTSALANAMISAAVTFFQFNFAPPEHAPRELLYVYSGIANDTRIMP